jgi:hypothetical protein
LLLAQTDVKTPQREKLFFPVFFKRPTGVPKNAIEKKFLSEELKRMAGECFEKKLI